MIELSPNNNARPSEILHDTGIRVGERTPLIKESEEIEEQDNVFVEAWYENIYLLSVITFIVSLSVGVLFYSFYNGWSFSTSLLAATSTLLGPVYDVPLQPYPVIGDSFTLLYFMWGQSIFIYCIGAAVGKLVANAPEIAAQERRKLQEMHAPVDVDGDGEIGVHDYYNYCLTNFLFRIGWEDNRLRILIFMSCFAWFIIGVLYGLQYEHWDLYTSVYFTLNALVQMGLATPPCFDSENVNTDHDCEFGLFRAVFLSLYITIGCPLFALTVAQFAGVVIEKSVRKHEREILFTPLSEKEYQFAANLYGEDEVLNLGEFTILELLRLQRVSMEDLKTIKDVFCMIDDQSTGNVDKPMLLKRNLLNAYGSVRNTRSIAAEAIRSGVTIAGGNKQREEQDRRMGTPSPVPSVVDAKSSEVAPELNNYIASVRTRSRSRVTEVEYSPEEITHVPGIRRFSLPEYNNIVIRHALSVAMPACNPDLEMESEAGDESREPGDMENASVGTGDTEIYGDNV